MYIRYHILTVQ